MKRVVSWVRRVLVAGAASFGLLVMDLGAAYAADPGGGGIIPDPAPAIPPGLEAPSSTLMGWMKWIVLMACALGVFVCLMQIAAGRRNRHAMAVDGASGLPWALGAAVGVGVMIPLLKSIAGG